MTTIYINIGSNKGDRHALIEQAVAFISSKFPEVRLRRSKFIETSPWGFDSDNEFLNLGIALEFQSNNCLKSEESSPAVSNGQDGGRNQSSRRIINYDDKHQAFINFLSKLQEIERKVSSGSHRDSEGNYIDREIDIDIIAIDDMVIDTPTLTIPHPRMHLRDFVIIPMLELAPSWTHPILGKSITDLALELDVQ